MAEGLETYGRVLEGLLPPAQPAGQGQGPAPLQGSLLQAAQKGLRYAWHAVRALPQAAAVFTSADQTAGWDTNKDRFHAYQGASAFTKLVQSAGEGFGAGRCLCQYPRGHVLSLECWRRPLGAGPCGAQYACLRGPCRDCPLRGMSASAPPWRATHHCGHLCGHSTLAACPRARSPARPPVAVYLRAYLAG